MEQRGNHPSIILWVVFNEAWGQFDTVEVIQVMPVHNCMAAVAVLIVSLVCQV